MIAHDPRGTPEDARSHLRPEELVLAIKALEDEVGGTRGVLAHADRRALRARLVTACIHAYFRAR
jgi:hypothetical protein